MRALKHLLSIPRQSRKIDRLSPCEGIETFKVCPLCISDKIGLARVRALKRWSLAGRPGGRGDRLSPCEGIETRISSSVVKFS